MSNFRKSYQYGLVPGPTKVSQEVLDAYAFDYAASDLEDEFYDFYSQTEHRIQKLLNTSSDVVIMTGEAMVVLWGALKSVIEAGDRVFVVGAGLFGDGFGEMAQTLGAKIQTFHRPWHHPTFQEEHLNEMKKQASEFNPKIITAVHCDTPSGSLNTSIGEIGKIAKEIGALFIVDMVSSVGGVPIHLDDWNIDLALVGSQKALSCPPNFSFLTVSKRAWKVIETIKYAGYDAILPFNSLVNQRKEFPYTPCWQSLAALEVVLNAFDKEGLDNVYNRHLEVQLYTIIRLKGMGIALYLDEAAMSQASPTCTAAKLPSHWNWKSLDLALRSKGVVFGGSWGDLSGKIFRIGHMGSQANMELVKHSLDILEQILSSKSI